ncbi:MAG: hypothetical protein SOX31_00210 [Eubacteriales bacterium]|nr:hypothetical protein [Eubacteriales bacterium]
MTKNTQPGLRDRAMQEALAALRQASPGISSALDAIAEQVKLSHPAPPASSAQPDAPSAAERRMPQATGFGEGEGSEGAELCETQDGHPAHTTKQAQTAPEQPASPAPQATRVTLAKEQRTALTREELVRSVVMAEVLGKPVAFRRGGRVI